MEAGFHSFLDFYIQQTETAIPKAAAFAEDLGPFYAKSIDTLFSVQKTMMHAAGMEESPLLNTAKDYCKAVSATVVQIQRDLTVTGLNTSLTTAKLLRDRLQQNP